VSSRSSGYYEAVSLDYRTAFEDFAGDGSTRFFLKNRPKEVAAESLQLRDKILDNIIRLSNYLKTFDKDFYHYKSMLYPTGVAFLLRFSSKIKDDAFGFSKDEFKVFNNINKFVEYNMLLLEDSNFAIKIGENQYKSIQSYNNIDENIKIMEKLLTQ